MKDKDIEIVEMPRDHSSSSGSPAPSVTAATTTQVILPQTEIKEAEHQESGKDELQESWWHWLRTKTTFGGLSQLSIAASFAAAPFDAISSTIANNSAVFFAIMYMFRKNKEVRAQNKELEDKIGELRLTLRQNQVDAEAISKTQPSIAWNSLGLFELQRDPMLYLLLSATVLDVANCAGTLTLLNLTSSSNASTSTYDSSIQTHSHSLGYFLGKIGTATAGLGAIWLALPQMWAAHNLRQYQTRLNKELGKLQQLEVNSLKEKNVALERQAVEQREMVLGLEQQLKSAREKIAVLEEQPREVAPKIAKPTIVSDPSQASLVEAQRAKWMFPQNPDSSAVITPQKP